MQINSSALCNANSAMNIYNENVKSLTLYYMYSDAHTLNLAEMGM